MKTLLRLGLSLGCVGLMAGCAAEPAAEATESTESEITAEEILCTFFQCEFDHGSSSRWMKIGEADTDSLFDHDRIDVGVNTRFSRIQLRVRDGGVNIHDFDVYFRDGSSFSPDFEHVYEEDSRSDVAHFPQGPRRIDSITLRHSKLIFGTGSTVEVWAKR